jgi:hypothetical protein
MNDHQEVDPTLLFAAAQDQKEMSLRQALAQFQTSRRPANWTSDTGGLGLVVQKKGVLFIEEVRNSDEFIAWMTNHGATFVPFEEENLSPPYPPMQQEDLLRDPRNWFGGDDPPPDDAFPTSSKRRGDKKR